MISDIKRLTTEIRYVWNQTSYIYLTIYRRLTSDTRHHTYITHQNVWHLTHTSILMLSYILNIKYPWCWFSIKFAGIKSGLEATKRVNFLLSFKVGEDRGWEPGRAASSEWSMPNSFLFSLIVALLSGVHAWIARHGSSLLCVNVQPFCPMFIAI